MVEPGFEILSELGVIANDYARRFDQAGFNGVVEAEVADDPAKRVSSPLRLPVGAKGVAVRSKQDWIAASLWMRSRRQPI